MRRAKAWEKCGGIGKVRLHFRHLAVVIPGFVIPGRAAGAEPGIHNHERYQKELGKPPRRLWIWIPNSRAKAPRSGMTINQTRRA